MHREGIAKVQALQTQALLALRHASNRKSQHNSNSTVSNSIEPHAGGTASLVLSRQEKATLLPLWSGNAVAQSVQLVAAQPTAYVEEAFRKVCVHCGVECRGLPPISYQQATTSLSALTMKPQPDSFTHLTDGASYNSE